MIGAIAYGRYSKKKDYQLFALSLRDIDKALKVRKQIDPAIILLKEYYNFLDIFSRKDLDILALYYLYNYNISLLPGCQPPALLLRNISRDKLLVIKKYLKEYLSKGWICASRSPTAALILLIKKPEDSI